MKKIVLITGSRSITERDKIFKRLDELLKPEDVFMFIEGEAQGIDLASKDWCVMNNISFFPMPITNDMYDQYGKGAGNRRNQDMLDKAFEFSKIHNLPVMGIAFWDGSSTGTQDMIHRMRKAGIDPSITLMGKPKTKRLL